MFKNETHNHPTEIEPFGGAATCIGGAIRDPLSGRSYVYQAMRVTGAADPPVPVSDTLPGKLPAAQARDHRRGGLLAPTATRSAWPPARWTSSTTPATWPSAWRSAPWWAPPRPTTCVREAPAPGDVVVLLGGRTGRDGMRRRHRLLQGAQRRDPGGAAAPRCRRATPPWSASSSACSVDGDAMPPDQALQRLRRRRRLRRHRRAGRRPGHRPRRACPRSTRASTAPSSPSPRARSAWPWRLRAEDVDEFIALRHRGEPRGHRRRHGHRGPARAHARGAATPSWTSPASSSTSNGAPKHTDVARPGGRALRAPSGQATPLAERMTCARPRSRTSCSNKGLSERFDSTIGAATVLMPFGGKTPAHARAQAMVAKLPVRRRDHHGSAPWPGASTPISSEKNPFAGAYLAVVESVSKLVAAGFCHRDAYLSFQEYFETPARRARALGQAHGRRAGRARWRRWTWAPAPSAARTP